MKKLAGSIALVLVLSLGVVLASGASATTAPRDRAIYMQNSNASCGGFGQYGNAYGVVPYAKIDINNIGGCNWANTWVQVTVVNPQTGQLGNTGHCHLGETRTGCSWNNLDTEQAVGPQGWPVFGIEVFLSSVDLIHTGHYMYTVI